MRNKYSITSNEVKLFKHMDNLTSIQNKESKPVMFHIAPTNVCNMNCTHCCFSERDKTIELDHLDLLKALEDIKLLGVKAIEWTGGGEPTLYEALPTVTKIASKMGFSIGMNTNGLNYREDLNYSLFSWVRISLNVFDLGIDLKQWVENVKKIQKQTKVTMCYIASENTPHENLKKVIDFAEEQKIPTRIAPDCIKSKEKIEGTINWIKFITKEEYGFTDSEYVFISDFNIFLGEREDNVCMMHMLKPFLYSDGYVYACPSSELAIENNRTMQPEFRICKMEDIIDYYTNKFEVKNFKCSYCKYTNQNNILNDLIKEVDDIEFC